MKTPQTTQPVVARGKRPGPALANTLLPELAERDGFVPEGWSMLDRWQNDHVDGGGRDETVAFQPAVTQRTSAELVSDLEGINRGAQLGPTGSVPPIDLGSVLDGRRSLLSLGEGASTFLYEILRDRCVTSNPPPVIAFDASYDRALAQRFDIAHTDPLRYVGPQLAPHYVGGLFQELDLRDASGERTQFDFIVTFWSLELALSTASFEEANAILERVVDHLKPGGVFMLGSPFVGLPVVRKVVEKLFSDGAIRNFALIREMFGDHTTERVALIQR